MTLALDGVGYAHRDHRVFDDLSLAIEPGKVTAILGPNGAGKTTLLRLLAGLIAPDRGRITLGGTLLGALTATERARRIGYLPQEGGRAWNLRARDLVALGRLPHRARFTGPNASDETAIEAALAATGTRDLADRPLDAMSGGERARILLARVIAGEPEWLLADEPLANLDPLHQRQMLRLMRNSARAGRGVVTVLHDLNAAASVADNVVLMNEGRLIGVGPVVETVTSLCLERTYAMPFCIQKGPTGQLIVVPGPAE